MRLPHLAVGATCTITVTFTPTRKEFEKHPSHLTDSAPGSPQCGQFDRKHFHRPPVRLKLSFGSVAEGATSAAQTVTVTNSGNNDVLTISSIAASSGFSETNNCAVSLPPCDNCVINVTYTPSSAGSSIGASVHHGYTRQAPSIVQLTGSEAYPVSNSPLTSSPPVPAGQTASYTLMITPDPGFHAAGNNWLHWPSTRSNLRGICQPGHPNGRNFGRHSILITTAVRTMAPPVSGIKMNPGAFEGLRHFGGWLTCLIVLLTLATLAGFKRRPGNGGLRPCRDLVGGVGGLQRREFARCARRNTCRHLSDTVTGTSGSSRQHSSDTLTLQVK